MHELTNAFIEGRAKFKKTEELYFSKNKKEACHYGALYWGKFRNTNSDEVGKLAKDYPILQNKLVPLPCNHHDEDRWNEGEIRSILIHLNDEHDGRSGWTDKKVAEWLEGALTS